MITNRGCKKLRDLEAKFSEFDNKANKLFNVHEEREELLSERYTIPVYTQPNIFSAEIDSFEYEDNIVVTVDGTEYYCKKKSVDNHAYYGESGMSGVTPIWFTYPFYIKDIGNKAIMAFKKGGRHKIKIESYTRSITSVSDDFRMAVEYVIDSME